MSSQNKIIIVLGYGIPITTVIIQLLTVLGEKLYLHFDVM